VIAGALNIMLKSDLKNSRKRSDQRFEIKLPLYEVKFTIEEAGFSKKNL
jgi:hypothetical protein